MLINKTHIFLSALTGERMEQKLELTLKRAGFHFEKQSKTAIETTHCSVHYISPSLNEESKALQAEEHFKMVMQHSKEKEHYKSFFWMPQNGKTQESGNEGNSFINRLQNNLSNNMILSTAPYPIQFVEDIRLILEEQPKKIMDTTPTDIFLICNQIDEAEAQQIHSMLSDIVAMVKLVIVQDQDTDYEEYASQQMNVSKLSVIYYHNGADWAMPFAQQCWAATMVWYPTSVW